MVDLDKWRFSSYFRIIEAFPTCSEGSHTLLFSEKKTRPRYASVTARLALALGFIVCCLASSQAQQSGQIIEEITTVGNRRIPAETIRAKIYTRAGDVYDEGALERDLRSVWNTGYFEDVRIEKEASPKGWFIHFYVREKPTIRTIEYHGLNSISQSDVLERFKKIKIPLSLESPYDPTKVIKAKVALQELLAEHGRQFATIQVQVQALNSGGGVAVVGPGVLTTEEVRLIHNAEILQ